MKFTDCRKRPVVDMSTATTLGKVDTLLVDPATRSVVAVVVKRKGPDLLRWPSLSAFGPDAVTVAGEDALEEGDDALDALRSSRSTLLGKRVLTDGGNEAGSVRDVTFDPGTGAVLTLVTSEGEVSGDRLVGVGSFAVVVRRVDGDAPGA